MAGGACRRARRGLGSGAAFAASAEKGKEAYMAVGCWGCHGTVGQGGDHRPEAGARSDADRGVRGLRAHHQPRHAALREPVLPNEDLADIHAYLASIPKPADYKTIPLLKPVARVGRITSSPRSDPEAFALVERLFQPIPFSEVV